MSASEADSTGRGRISLYLITELGLGEVATELVAVLVKYLIKVHFLSKSSQRESFKPKIKILQKFKDFSIYSTTQKARDLMTRWHLILTAFISKPYKCEL